MARSLAKSETLGEEDWRGGEGGKEEEEEEDEEAEEQTALIKSTLTSQVRKKLTVEWIASRKLLKPSPVGSRRHRQSV